MITHPNVINPFRDERFPFFGDNAGIDSKIERPTEHPWLLKLEKLLLLWNKIHSFTFTAEAKTIGSGPRQFTELQVKRTMVPLGEITPDVRGLKSHGALTIVSYGEWEKYPCVVMDYPVFITPRQNRSSYDNHLRVQGTTQRRWGEIMINLGRTKLALNKDHPNVEESKFSPQAVCFINDFTRSFANPDYPDEEKSDVGSLSVAGVEGEYLGTIPIYGFPHGGYTIKGHLKANGYFSEFRVEETTPVLIPNRKYKLPPIQDWNFPQSVVFIRQIVVSFPTTTEFIDYNDYLKLIFAGPFRLIQTSNRSIIGDRTFVSLGIPDYGVNEWSGPLTLAKANMDDWFLTDDQVHLPIVPPKR